MQLFNNSYRNQLAATLGVAEDSRRLAREAFRREQERYEQPGESAEDFQIQPAALMSVLHQILLTQQQQNQALALLAQKQGIRLSYMG
jgi:hypothetical protein